MHAEGRDEDVVARFQEITGECIAALRATNSAARAYARKPAEETRQAWTGALQHEALTAQKRDAIVETISASAAPWTALLLRT